MGTSKTNETAFWTDVNGIITVQAMGRTRPEQRYVLDTVLEHLPRVTGSGHGMQVDVIRCGDGTFRPHGTELQDHYKLVLHGSLRDRYFDKTAREFVSWICRLAKRVKVEDALASVRGCREEDGDYVEKELVISESGVGNRLSRMFELPSWAPERQKQEEHPAPAWYEYLLF